MRVRRWIALMLMLVLLGCLSQEKSEKERISITEEIPPSFSLHSTITPEPVKIDSAVELEEKIKEDVGIPINGSHPENYVEEDGVFLPSNIIDQYPNLTQTAHKSNQQNKEDSEEVIFDLEENELNEQFKQQNQSKNQSNTKQSSGGGEKEIVDAIDGIIDNLPPELQGAASNFLGDKELVANIITNMNQSNSTMMDEIKDKLSELRDPSMFVNNPLLRDLVIKSSTNTTFTIPTIASLSLTPLYRGTYEEKNNAIKKLVIERDGNGLHAKIYFSSPFLMYSYLELFPLSLFVDLDNDGEWDIEYALGYNKQQKKHYYYIRDKVNPWVNSRDLRYDANELSVTIDLKEVENYRRIFIWVGERTTKLRFPMFNDLLVFTKYAQVMKNSVRYRVIYLDKTKIIENGDWMEGEWRMEGWSMLSLPIERINSPEAREIIELRRKGKLDNKSITLSFALLVIYSMLRNNMANVDGLIAERSGFPMFRWITVEDGDVLFDSDFGIVKSAVPLFADSDEWLWDNETTGVVIPYMFDVDGLPSFFINKPSELLAKVIDSALADSLVGDAIILLVEIMYYGVTEDYQSFDEIFSSAFKVMLREIDRNDLLMSTPAYLEKRLPSWWQCLVNGKNAQAWMTVQDVNVPTVPMNVVVKLKGIKIKDRSDLMRGEFYFYGRVCTAMQPKGLADGVSFSWPAGKTGECVPDKKFEHGHISVWDDDIVARNKILLNASLEEKPFVYLELVGWDEDEENIGDDDDYMGMVSHLLLLDERNLRWAPDSNKPFLHLYIPVNSDKIKVIYTIDINSA